MFTCRTLSGILDLIVGITVGGPVGFALNYQTYLGQTIIQCFYIYSVNTYCGCMCCSLSSFHCTHSNCWFCQWWHCFGRSIHYWRSWFILFWRRHSWCSLWNCFWRYDLHYLQLYFRIYTMGLPSGISVGTIGTGLLKEATGSAFFTSSVASFCLLTCSKGRSSSVLCVLWE